MTNDEIVEAIAKAQWHGDAPDTPWHLVCDDAQHEYRLSAWLAFYVFSGELDRLRAGVARLVAAGEAVAKGRQAIRQAMSLGTQEWAKACQAYSDAENEFIAAVAVIKASTP